jgi:hypothetical protein
MERLPKQVIRALYRRSGGQCECTLAGCQTHSPGLRCTSALHGDFWKIMRREKKSSDNLRNLRAVCPICYKNYDTQHV